MTVCTLGRLRSSQWKRLADLTDRFEQSWQRQGGARLGDFLPPPGDPLRPLALRELIKTDLEMRWWRGSGAQLEHYVEQFPELGQPTDLPAELIVEEYLARRAHGDRPELSTYRRRFPAQFEELQRLASDAADAPATIAGYELLERLGAGSFGEVWRARAPGVFPGQELTMQPVLGQGPVAASSSAGNARGLGGLFDRQSGVVAEVNELAGDGVVLRQSLPGLIQG